MTDRFIQDREELIVSDRHDIDRALGILQGAKDAWREAAMVDRLQLLDSVIQGFVSVALDWVQYSCQAKSIALDSPEAGQEWLAGPYCILRNLRLLKTSLEQIEAGEKPKMPGPATKDHRGQWRVSVFPTDIYDKLFFMGTTAEVWLDNKAHDDIFANNQAYGHFHSQESSGKISLVLSAGNVSSIGPLDAIHKLFYENNVVIIKTHPVNGYLKPLLSKAFAPLITRGFVQLVEGGAQEGAYLCHHPAIADIHITGSDKTHDVIVFGKNAAEKKAARDPALTKPITSELGNVSPVLVLPGEWSSSDLEYQATNIASSLANNAGFNCNASRVLVTHKDWPQREAFINAIKQAFSKIKTRKAYYPGANTRYQDFLNHHPNAHTLGEPSSGELPWMFITDLDFTNKNDICFTTEAFCSVIAETPLPADSPEAFLDAAVDFANNTLWGTLNTTVLIHPKSLKIPGFQDRFEQAIEQLRFGTVSINHWAAVGFVMGSTTWGAYPGHDLYDIRSGVGVVHNTYMLENVEKTVIRGPFRMTPKPAWFANHGQSHKLGKKMTAFEARPSLFKLPGIFWSALLG